MNTDTWHATDDLLVRFAHEPTSIEPVAAASLEQHLVKCEQCRAVVSDATPTAAIDALWDEVADAIDRQPTTLVTRVLGRVHLDRPAIRLVAATGLLQAQAIVAVIAVTAIALLAARQLDTATPFLALAPIVVLGAVAVAFWPSMEPGGEVSPATPLYGFHLFLTRATVVIAAAVVPLVAASFVLPWPLTSTLAWVLPALALATVALALGSRYRPSTCAIAVALTWSLGLAVRPLIGGNPLSLAWMQGPVTQIVAAAVFAASIGVIVKRRETFDQPVLSHGGSFA